MLKEKMVTYVLIFYSVRVVRDRVSNHLLGKLPLQVVFYSWEFLVWMEVVELQVVCQVLVQLKYDPGDKQIK